MIHIPSHRDNQSGVRALLTKLKNLRESRQTYRRKRAVYRRTLLELESYRPHELADLGIHGEDFDLLARQQAGL